MFQIKLYNGEIRVEYNKRYPIASNNNCINCIYTPYHSKIGVFRGKIARDLHLKKNFKLIMLNNENYIIYNEKNQALIDQAIFNALEHLNYRAIENQELVSVLYELKFIVNE
jgi:hypothetical protein